LVVESVDVGVGKEKARIDDPLSPFDAPVLFVLRPQPHPEEKSRGSTGLEAVGGREVRCIGFESKLD
jgi:hypothetical protein